MAYKSPGAYARFVKTASPVSSIGSTRVMAIVGTGTNFYDVVNEGVSRTPGSTVDTLANSNIFDIDSLTSKPLYAGSVVTGSKVYKEGIDFEVKEGKYIAWKIKNDPNSAPSLIKSIGSTSGSAKFEEYVTAVIDGNRDYLVKNGKYRVEISYVHADMGAYRVVDENTQEVLGEFGISNSSVDVIPGVKLTVSETFVPKMEGVTPTPVLDPDGEIVSDTTVGDFVIIETFAGEIVDEKDMDNPNVPGAPADGETYYVSYTYKKPESEFIPKVFYSYDEVVAEYGNYDVTATGKVINSLALGAEIAFLNGVVPLVCVQARNDSDYEMKAAIDKLERPIVGISNFSTVVPLTSSKSVADHLLSHVSNMSLPINGKERVGYMSAFDGESVQVSINTAKMLKNERIVYVVPGSATKDIKDLRTGKINTRKVPGYMLAVAVASLGLKNDPAEPLTNKSIVGFKDLGTLYTESEMNLMAESGCLVLKQNGSTIKVRHGITTSNESTESSEITLVQIKDYVIEAARNTLGESYIGNKLKPAIVSEVESSLVNMLNQLQGQEIILGYGGVSVKRSTLNPTQIDVKFEIEAVYPLNYIDISFSFSGVN
jgi:Phage tail sheath protein.